MSKTWLLPCVLALQVLRGVLGEHCVPCQQVECRPLPSNCKYGVTFDRCGCCQVCVQSNGERCRFIPDANGIGFICEWGSVTRATRPIHDLITSQVQHPVGLDAFFRTLFDITKPSNNHRRAELITFNVLAKHLEHPVKALEDAAKTKVVEDGEQFKTYPTCGLYDYLTSKVTKRYETTTEKPRKRSKTSGKNRHNTRRSNRKGSFIGLDSEPLINEAEAMKKTNEIEHHKEEEVKSKRIKKQNAAEGTFKFKHDIGSFIDALKRMSIHRDLEGRRDNSKRSPHLRQDKNENTDHQGSKHGGHVVPDSPRHGNTVFPDSHGGRHEEMSVHGANGYSLTRGRPRRGVAKDEAQKLLGETLSDIMAMFVSRARAMHTAAQDVDHGNAATKQKKTDPIRLLGYLLKKKQQERHVPPQSDRRTADADTNTADKKHVAKDPDSWLPRRPNVLSNLIDGHHRISSRKNAHDKKDLGEEERLMYDSDFSSNEIEQFHNEEDLVADKREHTHGIKREGVRNNKHSILKVNGPLDDSNEQEVDSDNSLLEEPRQELGVKDNEWDGRKLKSGSYMNRLLAGVPQRSLKLSNYHVRQMLKRRPDNKLRELIRGGRWEQEGNEVKRSDNGLEMPSRKKRNAPTEKEKRIVMSAQPQSYGTFVIRGDGKVEAVQSNIGKKPFEELLANKFPGRVVIPQETTK